jgi:hypothetical protein
MNATLIFIFLTFLCIFSLFFIVLGRAIGVIRHMTIPMFICCALLACCVIAAIVSTTRDLGHSFELPVQELNR